MKKMMITMTVALSITGVASIGAYASNNSMSAPQQVSDQEFQQHLQEIQTIGTKYGEFERVDNEVKASTEETVTETSKVNTNTKKIVTEYGTFVKK